MKTERHIIRGACLESIETMASEIDYRAPNWVPYTVAIEGTETSALDAVMVDTLHFSGLLRQCSMSDFVTDGDFRLCDESGNLHGLEGLLDEAAERLDQAHQEWLAQETRGPLLDDGEISELRAILMAYCEDSDSSKEAGETVDNLWQKIKDAKNEL